MMSYDCAAHERVCIKAGSQSDARPCVALIRGKSWDFLTTRRKNATQGSARIGPESILASYCVSTSVEAKATQRNALYCEPAFTRVHAIMLRPCCPGQNRLIFFSFFEAARAVLFHATAIHCHHGRDIEDPSFFVLER